MNDEIKEILDDLLFTTTLPNVSIKLNKEKLNQLKDYITNLQQENILLAKENERLKEENALVNDRNNDYRRTKEHYKSRCEKAVEIAKDLKQFVYDELVDRNVSGATEIHSKIIDLLNILNSRSDE